MAETAEGGPTDGAPAGAMQAPGDLAPAPAIWSVETSLSAAESGPAITLSGEPLDADATPPTAIAAEVASAAEAASGAAESAPPAPSFVRKADRAARWRRPGVRLALTIAALVLAVVLAAQVAIAWRDTLAARWPATAPLLEQACAFTGCKVEPLRRIAALSVEASGLQQVPGTQIYRLAVVLRNRADLPLMLPAFDLTLTDSQGDVVVRRILTAAELGSRSDTIAAGAELSLEASLNAGDRSITGYTIETFYP